MIIGVCGFIGSGKDTVADYLVNFHEFRRESFANTLKDDMISEYFTTSIERPTNILLSEDYHFCKLARDNGIKVWAAPWVQLAHIGTYAFEGQLIPAP